MRGLLRASFARDCARIARKWRASAGGPIWTGSIGDGRFRRLAIRKRASWRWGLLRERTGPIEQDGRSRATGRATSCTPVLHEAGFASQAKAVSRDDGMKLTGLWITAVARCAPPGNKPTPEELRNCAPWLDEEMRLLTDLRVVVCLGRIAFDGLLAHGMRTGMLRSRARVCLCARSGIQAAGRPDRDCQLSSFAAKHEHRKADASDAAESFQAGEETGGSGEGRIAAGCLRRQRSRHGFAVESDLEGCGSG